MFYYLNVGLLFASHTLSNLIFTQFFKVGSILILHFVDEFIDIIVVKDPVPNHTAGIGGLPAGPTLIYYASWETLFRAGRLFSLQLWMENQEEVLHGRVFVPLPAPALPVFKWSAPPRGNSSGLPSLSEAVALDYGRLSAPRADILWLLSIGRRWGWGGELIEWVSNLVARVTLSWLEGRDHRVQHRLCWIGKWCLMSLHVSAAELEKERAKKGKNWIQIL